MTITGPLYNPFLHSSVSSQKDHALSNYPFNQISLRSCTLLRCFVFLWGKDKIDWNCRKSLITFLRHKSKIKQVAPNIFQLMTKNIKKHQVFCFYFPRQNSQELVNIIEMDNSCRQKITLISLRNSQKNVNISFSQQ